MIKGSKEASDFQYKIELVNNFFIIQFQSYKY